MVKKETVYADRWQNILLPKLWVNGAIYYYTRGVLIDQWSYSFNKEKPFEIIKKI